MYSSLCRKTSQTRIRQVNYSLLPPIDTPRRGGQTDLRAGSVWRAAARARRTMPTTSPWGCPGRCCPAGRRLGGSRETWSALMAPRTGSCWRTPCAAWTWCPRTPGKRDRGRADTPVSDRILRPSYKVLSGGAWTAAVLSYMIRERIMVMILPSEISRICRCKTSPCGMLFIVPWWIPSKYATTPQNSDLLRAEGKNAFLPFWQHQLW